MIFLTAHWSHLALINYAVDPALLDALCPRGLEVDTRDGHGFVSLVAFHFLDTRVLGVPWPGFRDFTEVNLRWYAREVATGRRGVVFVREFVPQWFVAAMARLTYNEPYEAVPMRSAIRRRDGRVAIKHALRFPFGPQRLAVEARDEPGRPAASSWAHWFKEQRWGYGTDHFGRTICYEVRHPHWRVFPVERVALEWDFARVYGPTWECLQGATPHSIVLAEGSRIEVRVAGAL